MGRASRGSPGRTSPGAEVDDGRGAPFRLGQDARKCIQPRSGCQIDVTICSGAAEIAALTDLAPLALGGLEREVMLRCQMTDGPAATAKDHRFRLRPEVVIDHAVEEFAVGDTGRGKGNVVAPYQVVDSVHASQIFEAGLARTVLVFAGA